MTAFWAGTLAAVPQPPRRLRPDAVDVRGRAADPSSPAGPCCAPGRDAARSSASCAATSPARRGRSTRPGHHARRAAAGRPAWSPTGCPSRCSRRRPRRRVGEHDENISFDAGRRPRRRRRRRAAATCRLAAYRRAADHAAEQGHHHRRHQVRARASSTATLVIADEVLTPDSSRFWPADELAARAPPRRRFDKQPVRDWLEATGLGQAPTAAAAARRGRGGHPARYVEAYERICGPSCRSGRSRDRVPVRGPGRDAFAVPSIEVAASGRESPTRRAPPSSGRCRRSGSTACAA